MEKKTKMLGFIAIFVVVMISGCANTTDTANMKLLAEYNLTKANLTGGHGGSSLIYISVTLPDNVKSITIKYNNISPVKIGNNEHTDGDFIFYSYNTVAQNGQNDNNYKNNVIDKKSVRMKLGDSPITGNITLNSNGAKSIGITSLASQGNIQVYIT